MNQVVAKSNGNSSPPKKELSSLPNIYIAVSQGGGSQQLYYHDCSGRISGHTTREPQVGFELETNGFQVYAITNLDKTSPIVLEGLAQLCLGIEPRSPT